MSHSRSTFSQGRFAFASKTLEDTIAQKDQEHCEMVVCVNV